MGRTLFQVGRYFKLGVVMSRYYHPSSLRIGLVRSLAGASGVGHVSFKTLLSTWRS
jgi:hypothetical protein